VAAEVSIRQSLQRIVNAAPRWPVYVIGVMPGAWIFGLALNDELGANPVKSLEHALGLWALRFLIGGLAITPVRRLTGLSLIRFRRALGLLAFFYVCAHFATYILLDRGLDLSSIAADILKRPYITVGMFGFAILIPLAVTSNAAMIRRMGGAGWQKLHRWVYAAAIAGCVHFLMSVKSWPASPLIYTAILAILLLIRAGFAMQSRRERSASTAQA
jgi:sulfoxide reductase heme-binding subunit YedZ